MSHCQGTHRQESKITITIFFFTQYRFPNQFNNVKIYVAILAHIIFSSRRKEITLAEGPYLNANHIDIVLVHQVSS